MDYPYSWGELLAISLDITLLEMTHFLLLKLFVLLVAPSLVIFFTYCSHFADLNKVLQGCVNAYKLSKNQVKNGSPASTTSFRRGVTFFLREHHRLVEYVLVGSRFWSVAVGISTVTNVPINLYILGHLFRNGVTLEESLFSVALILVMQFLGALNALLPIARMSACLHSAAPLFVPAVQRLRMNTPSTGSAGFHLKWKLAAYYEVIHSGDKISFHNGSFGGVVTKMYIFEVS